MNHACLRQIEVIEHVFASIEPLFETLGCPRSFAAALAALPSISEIPFLNPWVPWFFYLRLTRPPLRLSAIGNLLENSARLAVARYHR
jgi:hypothetical protein